MSDMTTGSGEERHPTGRSASLPDDEWAPEDAAAEERPTRQPLPGERLPGEPAPDGSPAATGAGDTAPQARMRRLPGTVAPGSEGPTADDRAPQDTARPGPGGHGAGGHGTEGLRPGTEDLGTAGGADARAGMRERSMGAGGARDLGKSAPGGSATAEDEMPDDGLGAPTAGAVTGREAATDVWPTAPAGSGAAGDTASGPFGAGAPLLPHDETDRWDQRIRQVTAGFVDEPRAAVEQADRALEEIAARFSEAVTRRRRTLRMSWEDTEARGPGAGTDTEQLRLALRDYRELAGRLLHL